MANNINTNYGTADSEDTLRALEAKQGGAPKSYRSRATSTAKPKSKPRAKAKKKTTKRRKKNGL